MDRLSQHTDALGTDSRHSRYAVRVRLFIVCLTLGSATGCQFPILVFPALEAGSGMTVRFRETDGKPIEREGLLIAHRSYRLPILWGVRGASWNRVVPIESGAAKLPCKWTLASIYIWWFYVPQIAIFPGDNLSLLPLVPGYYVAPGHSFAQPTTYLVHQTEIEEGYVALARSSDDLVIAIEYWKTVALEHLQPPGVAFDGYEPELRLPDGQYQMVKRFVEAEVDRLRALKRSVPPAGREPPGPKGREVVPTM